MHRPRRRVHRALATARHRYGAPAEESYAGRSIVCLPDEGCRTIVPP
uniref:Uncharacterized protein n=1 Tax=Nonomuraea gerenzanensis TaxID=93944 RepID=A0A1M4EGM3_9ACTN|nr:hypothetical protein BN4615_P7565 [Nonomuraea gerenzanensis]